MVILGAVLLKIPRFFHFQLNEEGSDYATSPLMENTAYIWANAYWDDLMITGFIPLLILIYFNLRIYLRVSYHDRKLLKYPIFNFLTILILGITVREYSVL